MQSFLPVPRAVDAMYGRGDAFHELLLLRSSLQSPLPWPPCVAVAAPFPAAAPYQTPGFDDAVATPGAAWVARTPLFAAAARDPLPIVYGLAWLGASLGTFSGLWTGLLLARDARQVDREDFAWWQEACGSTLVATTSTLTAGAIALALCCGQTRREAVWLGVLGAAHAPILAVTGLAPVELVLRATRAASAGVLNDLMCVVGCLNVAFVGVAVGLTSYVRARQRPRATSG